MTNTNKLQEDLRYLYWDENDNLSFCTEKNEDKELVNFNELDFLRIYTKEFSEKYNGIYGSVIAVKEGIYKLHDKRNYTFYNLIESFGQKTLSIEEDQKKWYEKHKDYYTFINFNIYGLK